MKYSIQELELMPINRLQNIDIFNGDDENIIQKIINKKLATNPIPTVFPAWKSEVTDNMTIEKEAELQKIIDDRNAKERARYAALEGIPDDPETEPIPEIVGKKFCDTCDSKGKFHKKTCNKEPHATPKK